MQEDIHKQNAKKEAREALLISSVVPADKLKDKGKVVLEGPEKAQPSSTLDILHKAIDFKKNLEKISSDIEEQEAIAKPLAKKQQVHEVIPQVHPQEEIPQPPPQAIQRVEQPEQQILQVPPIQQVEPFPQANMEVHEIHSDLEEENSPSTCPVDVSLP